MKELFEEIRRRNLLGESVAMATIVGSRGSTPRKAGARMIVFEDGKGMGSVGGGCVEADVWREAAFALPSASLCLPLASLWPPLTPS